jgi:[protein-PII] uridylyltransferase
MTATNETVTTLAAAYRDADTDQERLELLRSFVDQAWDTARESHTENGSGREVVASLTVAIDLLIQTLYHEAIKTHGCPDTDGYAIIALGGYGRGHFSPGSDIDLLFLYGRVKEGDPVTRAILHTLWDLRFEVGYSTRNISDCVTAGQEDVESLTAMLESRLVAGDGPLYKSYRNTIESRFTGRRARAFVQQKIREREQRHQRTGFSVQMQEPNLKENRGGLRDTHTVGWLLKARRNKVAPEGLLEERLLNRRSYNAYVESLDFLLRIRSQLHFQTKKKHDVLDYDLQPDVALAMGYEDVGEELGVERFMRDYYLHARTINHLSDLVCERLKAQPSVNRAVDLIVRRELDDGAFLSHTRIQLPKRRKSFFEDDPHRLLSLFLDAQRFGAHINEAAQQGIKDNLHLIDDDFRKSPKASKFFLDILRAQAGVAPTLRQMHELGVLGAYIPVFGGLTCLVQYNLYHIYTADEHTLVALENLEKLRSGDLPQDLRPLSRVFREIPRPELLYLALLLHDAGKAARGKDHSIVGAQMARDLLARLGLPEAHITIVEKLVLKHLNMSHISQRRDLGDESMIQEFASEFEDPDTLRMLYLLTYADLSAVTRTAWTAWKGHLLWELFVKSFHYLTGQAGEEETQKEQEIIESLVNRLTDRFDDVLIRTHLDGLPSRYSETSSEEEIARHLEMIEEINDSTGAVRFTRSGLFTEVIVSTRDHPYRLSQICGVLATNDLSVFSAQAYTRADGVVLDTFQVTAPDGSADVDETRKKRFHKQLIEVLDEKTPISDLFDRHRARWSRRRQPAIQLDVEIRIENDVSDEHTVIDVFAPDETGLLYRITRALSDLDLDIATARIGTQADRAVDAFYVRHKVHGKILDPDPLKSLQAQLLQKLADT